MSEPRPQAALARTAAAAAGLDALPLGIAILAARGVLIHANPALEAMAAQRDGFALGNGGLLIGDAAARDALQHAVGLVLAVQSGRIRLLPDGTVLGIRRPSGKPPWLVQVLPVRRDGGEAPGEIPGAVLLVTDTAARRQPSQWLLQKLLGLSPAEAALAAALSAGQNLAEYARRRGVSRETLRSQLAAIRRKTGCRRQADLVALVLRLGG